MSVFRNTHVLVQRRKALAPRSERPTRAEQREATSTLGRIVGARGRPQIRRALWGYLFALPWILGLIIFWAGPILVSFYYSFTDYNVIDAPKFVGIGNYARAFGGDDLFWPSIGRTLLFTLAFVRRRSSECWRWQSCSTRSRAAQPSSARCSLFPIGCRLGRGSQG